MAVHGTLNPELDAKARVDIYEGGGRCLEGGKEGGIDPHTHSTHLAD